MTFIEYVNNICTTARGSTGFELEGDMKEDVG